MKRRPRCGRSGCIESVELGERQASRVGCSIGGHAIRCEGMTTLNCLSRLDACREDRGRLPLVSSSTATPSLSRSGVLEHPLQRLPTNSHRRTTRPPLAKHRSTFPRPTSWETRSSHTHPRPRTPASHEIKPCQTVPLSHSHPSPHPRAAQASAAPSPAPPLPPPTRLPALPSRSARP